MEQPEKKVKVLFLCVANSCRSQMAEGIAKHFFPERIEAFSAGLFAAGVSYEAANVLTEIGIDISDQTSKHFGKFLDEEFDYVITLCGELQERCPVFPGNATHIHMSFIDPSGCHGTEERRLEHFRETRDDMKERLVPFLEGLLAEREQVGMNRKRA
jgi:arsenate reductase